MTNELEKVLEKHFRDDKILYFIVPDAIASEQFIRWSYFKHERKRILITVGSNDGEVDLKIFEDAEKLDQFIKLIIER